MAPRVPEGSRRAEIIDLARRLVKVEKRLDGAMRPRLVNASIENTQISEYDGDGVLGSVIGRQWDGTHGSVIYNGPPPPKPAKVTLEAIPTGILVTFDGTWDNPEATAPMDFSHFEIHAAPTNTPGETFSTLKGQIGSARGGQVQIRSGPAQPLYVWVVARSLAGRYTVGDAEGPLAGGLVTQDAIDIDWQEIGGNTINYGSTQPAGSAWKIGDLWFKAITVNGRNTYEARRWDGDSWELVADQGVVQAFLEAEAAAAAATLRARLFEQPDEPTGLGVNDKAIWVDTDDGNRSWTWSGSAWVSRRLGNGAIQPNSLIASDVIATGTVSAALFEAVLILASTIVAGSPTGAHVEINEGGIILYAVGPDGNPAQSGALGTGDDGLTFTDFTGVTKTSVTRQGISVESLDVSGVDEDSDGLVDSGFRIYGQEFLEYFESLPKGLVAHGRASPSDGLVASGISTTPVGLYEMAFTAKARRAYRITVQGLQLSSTDGRIRALVHLRGTQDGTTPTTSNGTIYQGSFLDIPVTGEAVGAPTFSWVRSWSATTDMEVRLLYVVSRQNGATAGSTITARTYVGTDAHYAPVRWSIEDVGIDVSDVLVANNGGGDTGSGGTASPTAKKTYTTTWPLAWEASFDNGGKRSDTDMYQGSYGGNVHKGYCGWSSNASTGEQGKTIVQALTGATVEKVEIRLHCNHSYSISGGTASIGYHSQLTEPSTAPTGAFGALSGKFFKRGETRWIALPSTTYDDWKSGNYRGIVVGPSGDYMRFETQSYERPAIRITYTR